jgi:hypothetical protein
MGSARSRQQTLDRKQAYEERKRGRAEKGNCSTASYACIPWYHHCIKRAGFVALTI